MTFLARPARALPLASSASRLGRLKKPPRSDSAPTRRVSRRVSPSQRGRGLPSTVIMAILSRMAFLLVPFADRSYTPKKESPPDFRLLTHSELESALILSARQTAESF